MLHESSGMKGDLRSALPVRQLLLREFLVAQRAAQNLADVGLRQLVAELDELRHLVAGQILAAMRDHLFRGQRRIALDDEHLHAFALRRVGHADCGDFAHVRMRGDHVLDFVRIDVEARHQDHVLLAVDQADEAARVHHADVAGGEPAVVVDHLGGFVRAVPVAFHHLRALHAQLARFADVRPAAVVLPEAHVRGRRGQADRAFEVAHVGRGRPDSSTRSASIRSAHSLR